MDFFASEDQRLPETIRGVDGVATAFKVSKDHGMGDAGFCITPDNLVRAEWTRTCEPRCGEAEKCRHFLGCRPRNITTNTKKLVSFDIGTNWMLVLGITPKRKMDLDEHRVVGPWLQSDWDELRRTSEPKYKPVSHVRVIFINPKTYRPIHENAVQIKLDGTFGDSFERMLKLVTSTVVSRATKFYQNSIADRADLLAHVPICATMSQRVAKSSKKNSAQSLAAQVTRFSFDTDLERSAIPRGSELSYSLLEMVQEARDWISGLGAESPCVDDLDDEALQRTDEETAAVSKARALLLKRKGDDDQCGSKRARFDDDE